VSPTRQRARRVAEARWWEGGFEKHTVGKVLIDAGSRVAVEAPTYLGALQAFTRNQVAGESGPRTSVAALAGCLAGMQALQLGGPQRAEPLNQVRRC